MISTDLVLLVITWLFYFVLHSVMADEKLKQRLITRFKISLQQYRFLYVVIASLLLLPPLWLTFTINTPMLWSWQGVMAIIMNMTALAGIAGFIISMKYYDGLAFLGLKPFQTANAEQPFILSPLHRYVRHPWYFFSLLIIWTRDMPAGWFVTCVVITLYLIIGSRYEEKKLILYFGDQYSQYQKKVPGLVPFPGKCLSRKQAEELSSGTV